MSNIRVGVLRGGPSSEYEVSLETGKSVLANLPEKYDAQDIFISRDGGWHMRGMQVSPVRAVQNIDVFFNALHGFYGEDGKVQKLLDSFGASYTGSGMLSSALGMNKRIAKEHFIKAGLKTPAHIFVRHIGNADHEIRTPYDYLMGKSREVIKTMSPPWVVKPVSAGSSVGVVIVRSYPKLFDALLDVFEAHDDDVLVEECISGREATCGIVDDFREHERYALPPVEIIPPPENGFFDYDAKYSGKTREVCPGSFTEDERERIQHCARIAHTALGLRHYSRSDFIVTPRGIYILESNTLPGLTAESLLPKSLRADGVELSEFLSHVVDMSLSTNRKKAPLWR